MFSVNNNIFFSTGDPTKMESSEGGIIQVTNYFKKNSFPLSSFSINVIQNLNNNLGPIRICFFVYLISRFAILSFKIFNKTIKNKKINKFATRDY